MSCSAEARGICVMAMNCSIAASLSILSMTSLKDLEWELTAEAVVQRENRTNGSRGGRLQH